MASASGRSGTSRTFRLFVGPSWLLPLGAHARYTEMPDVGHDCWDAAFQSEEVTSWLFAQRRARRD
jgi:hypothetical protein